MDPSPIHESPVPPMNLACPHCGVRLAIPPSLAGSTTACPNCGGRFQIPLPTAGHGFSPFSPGYGFAAGNPDVQAFVSKKVAAGVCGILLGGLGIHKFILGFNTAGIIMLVVWILGFVTGMCLFVPLLASMAMGIIGLVEGIIYLTKSDEDFYRTYAIEKREWF